MNIDKHKPKKSNLRIAHDNCSPLLSSSSYTFTLNMINNLNNNDNIAEINNNHINGSRNLNSPPGFLPSTPLNNSQNITSSKYANAISSPSLENTAHTISIASLNVRGFASN